VMLDYARRCTERAIERRFRIIVGDAPGIDAMVVETCWQSECDNVKIFGIANEPRNWWRDEPPFEYMRISDHYTARDRHMVETADIGMSIWDGRSRGTKSGYDYMMKLGKRAWLVMPRLSD